MSLWHWAGAVAELALREWWRNKARRAKESAKAAFRAAVPIRPRTCPRCGAFVYVPDQELCTCGGVL